MKQTIRFINSLDIDLPAPKPAETLLPTWYVNQRPYLSYDNTARPDGSGRRLGTSKKCMPLFDSMTAGYLISTHVDIFVSTKNSQKFFEWSFGDAIGFHSREQAQDYPNMEGDSFLKFKSPWIIKTPIGYSCLFVPPMHRDVPITIVPGVVDTDTYGLPTMFPAKLTDPNFEGLIPMGTPVAQAIPFKRESWVHETPALDKKEYANSEYGLLKTFYNGYKDRYWHKKSFK